MIWSCPKCGFSGSQGDGVTVEEHEFPVHCICGLVENYSEAAARTGELTRIGCVYLNPVSTRVDPNVHGCGCSPVYLHECSHFQELVTYSPVRKEKAVMIVTALHPTYQGRNCFKCPAKVNAG